ncbi:MAG TPA: S41 family peptidase [Tepidisphaeraceae bacterium]|nr:S41 family peptidase [Tepidisphaeraceae bacterium]
MKLSIFGLLVCAFALLPGCRSAKSADLAPIDDARRQKHVESFDQVWTTIRDQHWDKDLNGVDWSAARDELRPRVQAAKTDAEARAAMLALIQRLKQSHFGIIPSEAYERVASLPSGDDSKTPGAGQGDSGIHVSVVDGVALVTEVEANSPGAAAGVRPGWILESAGKLEVADVLKRVDAAYADSSLVLAYRKLTTQQLLSGDAGDTVRATFLDGSNHRVKKEIVLATPQGKPAKFGNLPTFYLRTTVKEVSPGIGYIAFNAFFDPPTVSTAFKRAVEQFEKADGFIIDLRGNPGGIGFMANGMAGYLVSEPGTKLGTMTMRSGDLKFVINPQPTIFKGPVAVLIDEGSMSTSEIMSGGLKDIGRARIFGTPTPGAALPSRIEKLPNGDGFQYAFANYVSAKGDVLEGKGVTPDVEVKPDRKSLLAGQDRVIEAAVDWIRSKK